MRVRPNNLMPSNQVADEHVYQTDRPLETVFEKHYWYVMHQRVMAGDTIRVKSFCDERWRTCGLFVLHSSRERVTVARIPGYFEFDEGLEIPELEHKPEGVPIDPPAQTYQVARAFGGHCVKDPSGKVVHECKTRSEAEAHAAQLKAKAA